MRVSQAPYFRKTGVAKCPNQAMMIEVVEVDRPVTLLIPVALLDHPDQEAVQGKKLKIFK